MADDWRDRLQSLKKDLPKTPRAVPKAVVVEKPAPPPPTFEVEQARLDDEALFRAQMSGVSPLAAGPAVVPHEGAARRPRPSEADDVMGDLRRLVADDDPFWFNESDEAVEAAVHDLDPRVLKKLKAGALVVEARLDLHGLTAREARPVMDGFIEASVVAGRRVVCVVTGRGLHSKDGVSVLKQHLKTWLTRSRLALHVLAFVSARPVDGGVGAVYVLLRRDKSGRERPEFVRE